MKCLLIILPLLLIAGEVGAIDRYDLSKMTCEEVMRALQSKGKAILMSPSSKVPGMMKFDKYVPDRRSCGGPPRWGQTSKVRAAGGETCIVYRCVAIARSTPRY